MEIFTLFETMSTGCQMFVSGLVIGAVGLAAAVILAICRHFGKKRLDRILNEEYTEGV